MLLSYDISATTTSVGIILNNISPSIMMKFGEAPSYDQVIESTNNIRSASTEGNLNSAVQLARTALFSVENGARTGIPKTLVIFVNDQINANINDLGQEASALQKSGVKIVLVGVGMETDMANIKPLVDKWFFPPTLPELSRIIYPIVIATLPGM